MTQEHALTNPPADRDAPLVMDVRAQQVVLDADLARLFGVETRTLNQQVRRNASKFDGFAFQLTADELANLRSQNVISSDSHGGRRHRPYAFTEHGVVMAATVVKSEHTIAASRFIIKVLVETRRKSLASDGRNLPSLIDARRLLPLESDARAGLMGKLNSALGRVLDAIADPVAQTTVREEAHAIAAEGLRSIKEYLKKAVSRTRRPSPRFASCWPRQTRSKPRPRSGSPRTSIGNWPCWPSS